MNITGTIGSHIDTGETLTITVHESTQSVIYLVRVIIVQRAQATWISRQGAWTHVCRGRRIKSHVHLRLCETEGMKSLSASLTHYCFGKHNTTPKRERQNTSGGVLLDTLFPHIRSRPNFGTNSDDAQSSSEPRTRMRNTHSLKTERANSLMRTCWQKQCRPPT